MTAHGTFNGEKNKPSVKSRMNEIQDAAACQWNKVVMRRLPPGLTEEALLNELGTIPEYEYFRLDDLGPVHSSAHFSRAYFVFKSPADVFQFRDRFDGYVFWDNSGASYPAIVELAPFQGFLKRSSRKVDTRAGTLQSDPDFLKFMESFWAPKPIVPTVESHLEHLEKNKAAAVALLNSSTPLIDYLRAKKAAKMSAREAERKARLDRGKHRESNQDSERKIRLDRGKPKESVQKSARDHTEPGPMKKVHDARSDSSGHQDHWYHRDEPRPYSEDSGSGVGSSHHGTDREDLRHGSSGRSRYGHKGEIAKSDSDRGRAFPHYHHRPHEPHISKDQPDPSDHPHRTSSGIIADHPKPKERPTMALYRPRHAATSPSWRPDHIGEGPEYGEPPIHVHAHSNPRLHPHQAGTDRLPPHSHPSQHDRRR